MFKKANRGNHGVDGGQGVHASLPTEQSSLLTKGYPCNPLPLQRKAQEVHPIDVQKLVPSMIYNSKPPSRSIARAEDGKLAFSTHRPRQQQIARVATSFVC
jgi:hypothetical protein